MYNNASQPTDSTIIFRYENSLKSFDTRAYSPVLTDGRLGLNEVQQTLQDVKELQQPYTQRIIKGLWFYLLFNLICISAYVYVIVDSTEYGDSDDVISAIIIYSVLVSVSVITFIVYVVRLRRKCLKIVQVVLDNYNQYLVGRGLRWNLPKQFPRWIELKKEYHVQDGNMLPVVNSQYPHPYPYGMSLNPAMMQGQPQQFAQNYCVPYAGNNGYNVNVPPQGYHAYGGGYNPQQAYIPPQQPYH